MIYKSINELPVKNWVELNKGDLSYLFINRTFGKVMLYIRGKKYLNKLNQVWETIYDEFIKEVGLTKEFKQTLELMKKVTLLKCENALNPKSITATRLAEAEESLESMTKEEKGNFELFLASVEKYMGIRVDLAKIAVARFYSYVKLMEREMANG